MVGRGSIRIGAAIAALTAAVLAAGIAPTASAATPCWKRVIADWQADRVLAPTYKPRCYRAALRHLPSDVRNYSDAESAIKRAMLQAVRSGQTHGVKGVQTKLRQLEGTRAAAAKRAATPAASTASTAASRLPVPMIVAIALAVALLAAAGIEKLRARFGGGSRRT